MGIYDTIWIKDHPEIEDGDHQTKSFPDKSLRNFHLKNNQLVQRLLFSQDCSFIFQEKSQFDSSKKYSDHFREHINCERSPIIERWVPHWTHGVVSLWPDHWLIFNLGHLTEVRSGAPRGQAGATTYPFDPSVIVEFDKEVAAWIENERQDWYDSIH